MKVIVANQAAKVRSQQNMTIFLANFSFLNPCQDGNMDTYAMTKELKKNAFKAKGENIKQVFAI